MRAPGMVTERGLAGVIRARYPPWVLWLACALLVVANIFNIGADLGGMADAMQMVTGIHSYYWTPFFALLIVGLLFRTSYRTIARTFKWLTCRFRCLEIGVRFAVPAELTSAPHSPQ